MRQVVIAVIAKARRGHPSIGSRVVKGFTILDFPDI